MKIAAALTILLAGVAWAGQTVAQPMLGDEVSKAGVQQMSRTSLARLVAADNIACVVKNFEFRARPVRDLAIDSPKLSGAIRYLFNSTCNNAAVRAANQFGLVGDVTMMLQRDQIRGNVFRAFYLKEPGKFLPLDNEPTDYSRHVVDEKSEEALRYLTMARFASCVLRAAPQSVYDFVFSIPGGTKEDEAFKAVSPVLGPCLQAGSEVALNKIYLSAIFSEALYRETKDARS